MILSYSTGFFGEDRRHKVNVTIATEQPASKDNLSFIVLEGGSPLDSLSWGLLQYRIEQASKEEVALLAKIAEMEH